MQKSKTKSATTSPRPRVTNVSQPRPAARQVTSTTRAPARTARPTSAKQLVTRPAQTRQARGSIYADLHSRGGNVAGTSIYEGAFDSHHNGNTLMASGTERLQAITDATAQPSATPYGNYLFNPLSVGSRLPLIATNFTKYRFTKVCIHYVPQISPANANASGTVLLAADTDPEQALPPTGEQGLNQLYSYDNKTICPVVEPARLQIDLDLPSQANWLYLSGEGDPRLLYQFDLGAFRGNATTGSALTFGQLYFSYTVELAQAVVDGQFGVQEAHAAGNYTTSTGSTVTVVDFNPAATVNPFPNTTTWDSGYAWAGNPDFLSFKPGVGTNGTGALVLDPGRWFVRIVCSSAASTIWGAQQTLTIVQGANAAAALIEQGPNGGVATSLGESNNTINRYVSENMWVVSAPTGCAVSIQLPGTTTAISGQLFIQIFAAILTSSGSNLSPAQLKPRVANPSRAWDLIDADNDAAVTAAVRDCAASGTTDVCAAIVARCFGYDVEDVLDPSHPQYAIHPAVAGVVAWFISKYGPSLTKEAIKWAVKKLETYYKKAKK
jgi:hypothetical protein